MSTCRSIRIERLLSGNERNWKEDGTEHQLITGVEGDASLISINLQRGPGRSVFTSQLTKEGEGKVKWFIHR